MFRRIKELNKKHPAIFVILGYMLLWLLICVMLTGWLGQDIVEVNVADMRTQLKKSIESDLEIMRKNLKPSESGEDNNKLLINDFMDDILSYIQHNTEGEVYGYWRTGLYDEGNGGNLKLDLSSAGSDEDNTVIMKLIEEDGATYLSCPRDMFNGVYRSIDDLRKEGYFVSDSYGVYLSEGYRKGNEFRPLIVNIRAYDFADPDRSYELQYILLSSVDESTEGFVRMENLNGDTNLLVLPHKNDSLNPLTESEMIAESLDSYGDKAARYFTYLCYCWDSWSLHPNEYFNLESLEHRFLTHLIGEDDPSAFGFGNYEVLQLKKDGNPYSGFKVPFSELKGDLSLEYYNILEGADGEKLRVMFFCIIKNGLGREMEEFYRSMLLVYIGLAVFFLFLAWYWLKHFYSLEGKSRFHKSLINSMAHDLKTPLMIMQGFGENLKDDIHREKHGYYAEQIVENAEYLNGLINKNLDVSNKTDSDQEKTETVHLSELVKKAEKRYKERLEDKNLKIKQEGVSFLEGDPEIIGIMTDNLISNAIKYSFEGETIEVFGAIRYFTIKNKAELHYNKSLKHLLDPLEMGDESRTAGSGTGLGLSIANGIAQECGWRLKLSYDRKNKIFTCKVILRKWL